MTASNHDKAAPSVLLDEAAASARTPGTLTTPEQLTQQHQRFLAAATTDNTRRTYRSAVRHFQAWGGVLPCDQVALIRYLLAFADVLNPRTLALRLTALSQWHRYQGFPDPAASATVRKTLRGIERVHGRPRQKAKALLLEDLERIVAHLDTLEGLAARRDSALLQVGYFGAFRRSELVTLEVENLQWEREGLQITLPRSKTDQGGEGLDKAIPYGDSVCCPARALRCWLDAAQIEQGPLFRRISRWGVLGEVALHEGSVNTILATRAEAAGLSYVPEMSSHSLRRGLATSAHRAGADFLEIKRQGGWRHDGTVHGYIEEARAFEENAAGSLLRRKP
ncbi:MULTISPECIES: site-specific integrase [Pseudomonas]|uniref:site-specific integrase n=1 Tax=Pseudomonas TaxID=286 RepID=UPI0009EBC0A0|nr:MULTISPECIES: tyrosine-type recombinase/integrase [Pseudomonas]